MKAYGISAYDGQPGLLEIPEPNPPVDNQVAVSMTASSFNPVDALIAQGYGAPVMNRRKRFPVVLGRDGCGTVTAVGPAVTKVKIGERVAVAVSPTTGGTYAERIVLPQECVESVGDSLSDTEAAAVSYVGSTAVQALNACGVNATSAAGLQVCINGASGGLGSVAIQMLGAWGAEVTAVCSAPNHQWVTSLGADTAIDYRDKAAMAAIRCNVVLNAAPPSEITLQAVLRDPLAHALKQGEAPPQYSTVITPTIGFITKLGALPGLLLSGTDLLRRKFLFKTRYRAGYHWIIFRERETALRQVLRTLELDATQSVTQETHPMDALPAQFAVIANNSGKGKSVFVW